MGYAERVSADSQDLPPTVRRNGRPRTRQTGTVSGAEGQFRDAVNARAREGSQAADPRQIDPTKPDFPDRGRTGDSEAVMTSADASKTRARKTAKTTKGSKVTAGSKRELVQDSRPPAGALVTKRPRGRPRDDRYEPKYVAVAAVLTLLGYSKGQLIEHFGTCKKSFYNWLARYPELAEAVKKNGAIADAEVAAALRQRALGMTVREEKAFVDPRTGEVRKTTLLKEIPPSEVAAMMWLSNRQPDYWRHRSAIDLKNSDGSFEAFGEALCRQGKALEAEYRVVEPRPAPPSPTSASGEAATGPPPHPPLAPSQDAAGAKILQLLRPGVSRLIAAPTTASSDSVASEGGGDGAGHSTLKANGEGRPA